MSYIGENLVRAFGGNSHEHVLVEVMKEKFKLVNKPRGYAISTMSESAVKVAMLILVGNIM